MVETLFVFISYSHKDEELREQLEAHLSMLRRNGLLETWHDRMILPGMDCESEIDERLETCQLILLLVSADFVDSDYCYAKEMKRALERQQEGTARVVPILLRPFNWELAPFARIQGLPRGRRPCPRPDPARHLPA